MNYDQRIAHIKEWFGTDILTRFNMPRDLDPKIVALDIIEAINRNLPNKTTKERMHHFTQTITKEVTQTATSRTLPQVKAFTDACKVASQSHGDGRTTAASDFLDPWVIAAKRIASGQPVNEDFLKEPRRSRLISEYKVSESSFEQYNKRT